MADPRYACLRKLPNSGTVFNDDFPKKPWLIKRDGNSAIYVMDSTYYQDLRLRSFRIYLDDDGNPMYKLLSAKYPNNNINLINFNDIVWDASQKIGCYMYSEYNGSYYDRYAYYLFEVDEVTGIIDLHSEVVMSSSISPDGKWNIKPTGEILHLYETYPGYLEWTYWLRAGRINKSAGIMEWGSPTQIETLVSDYGRGGIIKYDPLNDKFLLAVGTFDPVHHPQGYTHNWRVVDVNGLTLTIGSAVEMPNSVWNPPDSRIFPHRHEWEPIRKLWVVQFNSQTYLAPGVFYRQYNAVMTTIKISGYNITFGQQTWDERVAMAEYGGDLLFTYNPLADNIYCLGQEQMYASYGEFSFAIRGTVDGIDFSWDDDIVYCPDELSEYADDTREGMWCPEVNAFFVMYEGYNTYWIFYGALPEEFWTNWQGQTEYLTEKSVFGYY